MASLFVKGLFLVIAATAYASPIESNSYVVSVINPDGGIYGYGALIDERFVLTTAQILAFYDPMQSNVTINGVQNVGVEAFSFNNQFDFINMENNIGLLKLAEPVKADYIQLANEQPATGTNAVLSFWNTKHKLVNTPVNIVSTEDCASEEYAFDEIEVQDTMVCGVLQNICVPHFGSPLVANGKLVGLNSWGGCRNVGKAAIFTDVASLNSWIAEKKTEIVINLIKKL